MRKTNPYLSIYVLTAGLFISLPGAFGQQKPIHSQYILNNYLLNPALSGIENYTDVKLSYRNQWTGIDGAPVTTYFSCHKPFGHDKEAERNTATSFGKRGANLRGERRYLEYQTPTPHHGAGIIVMNDRTGYINRFSAYLTYAYHRPVSQELTLAAGFQAGFSNTSLDRSKIIWGSLNPNDPAIGLNNGELSKFLPEIGAGLWLYAKDYFIGTSVLNILPGKANFSNAANYGTYYTPHLFITGGYRLWVSDDITALPSVNLQFVQPFPIQVHTNLKLQYRDMAWIGAGYRISDQLGGMTAMAGFNVSNTFNVGYAYDLTFNSRLSTYSRNSHEIIIGFLLNNSYGDLCPRNVW